MRVFCLILILLPFCFQQKILAQSGLTEQTFRDLSPEARRRSVFDWSLEALDSAAFIKGYEAWLPIAQAEKDVRTSWLLRYEYFQRRQQLRLTPDAVGNLLKELEASATAAGMDVEQLVAHHYLIFHHHDIGKIRHEQLYAAILHEYEQLEALGFEKFKDYNIARMLFHLGRFLYRTEDFGKALPVLLNAERLVEPEPKGRQTLIFILNHIQSIHQQHQNYPKGIEYAKKILQCAKNCAEVQSTQIKFCPTWQGIASIDIASMLIKQGQFAEGEQYATEGYKLVRVSDPTDPFALQAEYDALQVLISSKLELRKLDKAAALLHRVDEINAILDYKMIVPEYFKHARFYQSYAQYYELKGDYAAAMRYTNRAKPLQDSLARRNDARKLEKIQQRLDAERYSGKLHLVEKERQLQQSLRNVVLLALLLVIGAAIVNFRRLRAKLNLSVVELDVTRTALTAFTQMLKERSEAVDALQLKMEQLTGQGERNERLEKLSRSTILTNEHWAQFRGLFEKVYPDFIATQKALYPHLTQAELRYLVLEKLDLGTHEMANMLGVSDGTIRQTRMRLRRKTNP